MAIAVIILVNAVGLLQDALNLLLEGVPEISSLSAHVKVHRDVLLEPN